MARFILQDTPRQDKRISIAARYAESPGGHIAPLPYAHDVGPWMQRCFHGQDIACHAAAEHYAAHITPDNLSKYAAF